MTYFFKFIFAIEACKPSSFIVENTRLNYKATGQSCRSKNHKAKYSLICCKAKLPCSVTGFLYQSTVHLIAVSAFNLGCQLSSFFASLMSSLNNPASCGCKEFST